MDVVVLVSISGADSQASSNDQTILVFLASFFVTLILGSGLGVRMPCYRCVFLTGPLRPPLKSPLAANLCCGNFFMKKQDDQTRFFLAASRVEKKFFRVFSFALKLFSNGFFLQGCKNFRWRDFWTTARHWRREFHSNDQSSTWHRFYGAAVLVGRVGS